MFVGSTIGIAVGILEIAVFDDGTNDCGLNVDELGARDKICSCVVVVVVGILVEMAIVGTLLDA